MVQQEEEKKKSEYLAAVVAIGVAMGWACLTNGAPPLWLE